MTILDINHKQEELINELFEKVRAQFPQITRQEISVSPEDKEHLWVFVDAPLSEEEEVEFFNFTGDLEADILLETGYWISLMPRFSPIMEHVL